MKLPNFIKSAVFITLKNKMGIPVDHLASFKVEAVIQRLTEDELDKLTSGIGLEVTFDELVVLEDGTLSYKGRRVLLYIRDVANYFKYSNLPKYHLASCRTLDSARQSGRFNKYVIANRNDGVFSLNTISGANVSSRNERLNVCQNCLDQLKIGGFTLQLPKSNRTQRVNDFRPQTFFDLYPIDLHSNLPMYDEIEAPLNNYLDGFHETSAIYKASKNWKCEKCKRDFSEPWKQKFLNTHHKNGIKSDDTLTNFNALCIECHASQPKHDHMKNLPIYKEFKNLKSMGHI